MGLEWQEDNDVVVEMDIWKWRCGNGEEGVNGCRERNSEDRRMVTVGDGCCNGAESQEEATLW